MRPRHRSLDPSTGRGFRPRLLLLCLLIVPAAALAGEAVPADAFGRSAADLAMEDFLENARIVAIEDVGEGITRPKRLTLERNVLVDLERDVFHPIDHSRAFRLSPRPPQSNRGAVDELTLPERVDRRLRAFDLDVLHDLVGDLLKESQVRAVIKRRDRLVKMLDKRSA